MPEVVMLAVLYAFGIGLVIVVVTVCRLFARSIRMINREERRSR